MSVWIKRLARDVVPAQLGNFCFTWKLKNRAPPTCRGLFEGFAHPGEGGKTLRCKDVPPTKYGGEDEGGEESGIRAFYFPADNEIAAVKSIAKVKRTATAEEVRLQTSVEEG